MAPSPHPRSQLSARRERKAVPYCCKPLPGIKGSVTELFLYDLRPICALRPCLLGCSPQSPGFARSRYRPTWLERAAGFESESLQIPSTKASAIAKPSRMESTFDIHDEEFKLHRLKSSLRSIAGTRADCRGHARREPSVLARLRGSRSVSTDGLGSARI